MNKEFITNKQGISLIAFFIIGSTLVVGVGLGAKQDGWLSTIISAIAVTPLIAIYVRILTLFPEKNMYEIITIVFNKYVSKIIIICFIWYSLFLGSLVCRNFLELVRVVTLQETPEYMVGIFLILLVIWVSKEGIEVLGRFSQFSLIFVVGMILLVSFLSFTNGSIYNFFPVLYNGFIPVVKSSIVTFSFPFAEIVCFLLIINVSKKNKPYKMFYGGWLLGFVVILLVCIRNIYVLGPVLLEHLYFPSHTTVSLIKIGDFIQRIEVTVTITFFFGGFVKSSVCLLSSCNGIKNLFKFKDYRQIVFPMALLMLMISLIVFENTEEMMNFIFIYPFYAFPFQVILPSIIWIAAEWNILKKNIQTTNDNQNS